MATPNEDRNHTKVQTQDSFRYFNKLSTINHGIDMTACTNKEVPQLYKNPGQKGSREDTSSK